MNILLLTDSDVFAGTERHMLDLAEALHQLGRSVMIACPEEGVLADRARSAGLEIFAVKKGRGLGLANVSLLARELRERRVDVIHAHNGRTALWGALATWIGGRGKLLATQHFLDPARTGRSRWRKWMSQRVHHWIGSRAARIVAISEAVRASIFARQEIDMKKVQVVLNGIAAPALPPSYSQASVRASLNVAESAPLIVCCARLEAEKQVGVLVSAMLTVAKEIPNARCVVAGEGSLKSELEAQIAELGLGHIVELLGFRNDALEIVAASDLFVLPSLAEPFGLSVVEAMALGKPVIATRAGGPLEIVAPEETGLLAAPRDAVQLSSAILRILQDRSLAQRMGRNGRERFLNHFTSARMAREIDSIYQCVHQGEAAHPPLVSSSLKPVEPNSGL